MNKNEKGTVEYPLVIGGYQLYVHIVPKEISKYDYDKLYVGITQGSMLNRWHGGSGYIGQVFGQAIKKYGKEKIKHIVIYDSLCFIDANILEKVFIKALRSSVNDRGYNVAMGGQGSAGVSPINRRDLTGLKIGKLTVVSRAGSKRTSNNRYRSLWYCKCECGGSCISMQDNLLQYLRTNGKRGTGSCGCMSSRNFGTPKPNNFDFYDNYVIGHCNNGNTFTIDIDDYEKIKHRTWTVETRFNHVIAVSNHKYKSQRIESIILDVPTHNIDKLRLQYKNGDPTDIRKSNLIIYKPECNTPEDYSYFIHNIVANGIIFSHGDTWVVGRNGDKKHCIYGLEQALIEYKTRYGDDFLTDYLLYKNGGNKDGD